MDEKKVKEWFFRNMQTHTDWTGIRVETKYNCESVKDLVNDFINFMNN